MGDHPGGTPGVSGRTRLTMASALTLVVALLIAVALPAKPQSSGGQTPAAQAPPAQTPATPAAKMPDWQIAAGGKMEFDVASVKQDTAPQTPQTTN